MAVGARLEVKGRPGPADLLRVGRQGLGEEDVRPVRGALGRADVLAAMQGRRDQRRAEKVAPRQGASLKVRGWGRVNEWARAKRWRSVVAKVGRSILSSIRSWLPGQTTVAP